MVPNFSMAPIQEAMMLFTVLDVFLRGPDANKRSSALESFPVSYESVPWRRVYKPLEEAQSSTAYPITELEHWEASELSFGGAGTLWCFTKLQRSGDKVSRKTEDGQTWSSKSGRGPRNGFPQEIRVDKLVISGKAFDMLELTLSQEKPTIALCKIWRKGSSTVASPQTPKPSVFSLEGSTSPQVFEDHFLIHDEPTEMSIDQPQGCIQSIAPDDEDTTYQDAVSFLHRMKGSFKQVAIFKRDEARKIASAVQNAATSLKNALGFKRINADHESTMPLDSIQLPLEPAPCDASNLAALAPETTTQDEFPDEELNSCSMENSFFDVGKYLDLDGGNGTSVPYEDV